MKQQTFGKKYADQYDLFYEDKDYEAECNMIEEIFQRYSDEPVHSILDLGCGTGNHAIPLALRGYDVTGIDRSPAMLALAEAKIKTALQSGCNVTPTFQKDDVRSLNLGSTFDAVLMMFAVLGYQLANEDVLAALRTVRKHLRPGGIFICDVWYGPAVLVMRPGDRIKVIETSDGQVVRAASGALDVYHHTANVHYRTWAIKGQQVISEANESHQMRYFFPQELSLLLAQVQMKLLEIANFNDFKKPPAEKSWNCLTVGEAV